MYKKCMRSHCVSDFIYWHCKVLTLPSPYTLEYTYEYIYKKCQVQIYWNFLDSWFDIKVEYVLKKTKAKLIFVVPVRLWLKELLLVQILTAEWNFPLWNVLIPDVRSLKKFLFRHVILQQTYCLGLDTHWQVH